MTPSAVPLVEVVRSEFVEGRHHACVVAVDPSGAVLWSAGAVDVAMLPRSCAKPLQAVAMLRAGLDLDGELLALACASHSGEPFHVDGVRRLLASVGLDESALRCPADWPFDPEERLAWAAAGGRPDPVHMNCSGKHAAMLATCAANGWDPATYPEPHHPLQRAIRDTVAELTGDPVEVDAVDGCGAPLMSTTLAGLARAFGRIAAATDGPEARVAAAIRAHPTWVSGTRRDEAQLIRAVPGAVAKVGAEGCYAVGLADGRGVALKVEDGGMRAVPVLMAAALARLGVPDEPGVDAPALAATGVMPLLGGEAVVGGLRAALP